MGEKIHSSRNFSIYRKKTRRAARYTIQVFFSTLRKKSLAVRGKLNLVDKLITVTAQPEILIFFATAASRGVL
jgi:hypothetical protein